MKITKLQRKKRIHNRIRKKVSGTPERPRLSVFRSNKGIYCQLIDDAVGNTIAAASYSDKDMPAGLTKTDQARAVGKIIASRAQAANIAAVVFDRGGYLYHGRVKALAEGAREGGLKF
jgi:large subunit ribosomal protein L18